MYSLLVADDHPLFRDALHAVISSGFTDAQLLETDSLAGAMAHIEALEGLDLLLLDLSLPDADGLEGLKTLRETFPGLPVAIVSAHQERQLVLDAITLGAVGYIQGSSFLARCIKFFRASSTCPPILCAARLLAACRLPRQRAPTANQPDCRGSPTSSWMY